MNRNTIKWRQLSKFILTLFLSSHSSFWMNFILFWALPWKYSNSAENLNFLKSLLKRKFFFNSAENFFQLCWKFFFQLCWKFFSTLLKIFFNSAENFFQLCKIFSLLKIFFNSAEKFFSNSAENFFQLCWKFFANSAEKIFSRVEKNFQQSRPNFFESKITQKPQPPPPPPQGGLLFAPSAELYDRPPWGGGGRLGFLSYFALKFWPHFSKPPNFTNIFFIPDKLAGRYKRAFHAQLDSIDIFPQKYPTFEKVSKSSPNIFHPEIRKKVCWKSLLKISKKLLFSSFLSIFLDELRNLSPVGFFSASLHFVQVLLSGIYTPNPL